jgi:signal transduction histidine kinase/ligand-binding sensor domain-containing protein/DNA-binding response OmpR family regulator
MQKTILIFHLLLVSVIQGQNNDAHYVMEYINTSQGLPHDYVTSIISDDLNVKWMGTENGLTKFNGYNFENIKPGKSYKKLKNENIEVLFKDKFNIIWIGTKSGGISSLDLKNNTIKNYNHLIDIDRNNAINVTAIAADDVGNIWIGTWEDGVFVINPNQNKLIKHIKISSIINCIIKDYSSNMWISFYQTLSKFNTSGKLIKNYNFKTNLSDIILDSKHNKIWIGTANGNTKLYYLDIKTQKIDSIETNVNTEFYKTLSLDAKNRLWIGTWGKGLYCSNNDLTKFNKIELVSPNSGEISSNYKTILKIHHDKNHQVWVATASGGVVKLIEYKEFNNANQISDPTSFNGDFNFTALYKNKNNIFVGTLNEGLFMGKDFKNLRQIKEIESERIISLYGHQNYLFVGAKSCFYIYDLIQNKIVYSNRKILKATSFYLDRNNTLFIGTQQKGIAIVPFKDINNYQAFTFYSDILKGNNRIENSRITSIKEDSQGNIWVGTYTGLHLFDKVNRRFNAKSLLINDKLPSVIINSIVLKDNYLWLGTPSGLVKLEYKNKKLTIKDKLTKEDGLNSDFICDMTLDAQSNIWMSTKTEIVKYNEQKHFFINYGKNDGVKTTSFNNRSLFNYENNQIYFGGIDNITYFNPNEINNNYAVPDVIFTNLRVNNSIIQYPIDKNEHNIIDKNFSYVDKIQLSHNDKFFSVGFITNDFLGNLNIKYRYKLEGYQNKWLDLQNQNEINFTGLSSGKYTLKVSATRDNQTWSKPKSIVIEILNSPWKSTWAITAYIILTLLSLYYILKFYKNQLMLKNNLEIAKNEKEKEIELSELKLNFFTNISHEFRTPLTLIISPLIELMENPELDPKVAKKLGFIDRNANRLLNLINQLLDFRKAEYGLLQLNVSKGNIVRFSKEVHLYFREMAKSKGIKYKFKHSEDEIIFPFDRNKIEIVLCNLLSNAIKYCSAADKITIEVAKEESYCIITVKDSGLGMEADYLDKIFDHFYQIKSAESTEMIGSGIGLSFSKKIIELHHGSIEVKSEINKGTEFIIKLPLYLKYSQDEIDTKFINTDNIEAYNTKWNENQIENLNISTKENTLLLIDDNQEILDYLKDILSDSYNILMANDGDEGFKIASTEIPDLIVSDVMMPGKDGITLCKELKSQIITSHIPVILLTARSSTVFEIQGLQTGADDYITKPFNPTIIKARIESLLENRKKIRTLLLNKIQFEPTQEEIAKDSNTESAFIHKAILLVENNLQNSSFSIDTMVEELNMSQSTLYRKIKSLTGLSLTSFIRSIRLKKAAHLILIEDLNLSQIAYEVGFNDYKYFKISFEKQFDCLPSKYKEKMTKKHT